MAFRLRPEHYARNRLADKIEKRVERAFLRANERIVARLSIEHLTNLLAAADVRKAQKVLIASQVKEDLEPIGTIVRDTFPRGGRLGAEDVNRFRKKKG